MYDYVVVGAGSAGCVLAARLSEDPAASVCLVEAGPADTHESIHIPVAGGNLFRSRLDWDYDSHPEPFCDGRRVYLPRGRVLGGSSSINGMIYVRGCPADYDEWDQPGWGYREILPYFLRSEDNERGATAFHGTGGPLGVCDGRALSPSAVAFVAAAVSAGFPANDDFNGPRQEGFGNFQVTQRAGRRCSSATAFLHPAMARPNLTVETNLQVHRVHLEKGRATAVIGSRLDELIEIRADREIIVAAGAYNSPQLLMLSGVGPADSLRALNIPVVVDHPWVGWNLQDHPHAWLGYEHSQPVSLLRASEDQFVRQYEQDRSGPISSNGPESGGFVMTDPSAAGPDLQLICVPVMLADNFLSPPTAHAVSFGASVLKPRSRGQVTLVSPEPTAKPRIAHNYYGDPADLELAVAGAEIALEISQQKPLKPFAERAFAAPASASADDLRAFARSHIQSQFHPVGTCAMGLVVDSELRVLGVGGLRVVDASVMPTIVRGNTNAPTIAIAEKAADMIRGVPPLPAHAALEDPAGGPDLVPD
jgi:choline dehydrogenase